MSPCGSYGLRALRGSAGRRRHQSGSDSSCETWGFPWQRLIGKRGQGEQGMGVVGERGVVFALGAHGAAVLSVGRPLPAHQVQLTQRTLQRHTREPGTAAAELEARMAVQGHGLDWEEQCLSPLAAANLQRHSPATHRQRQGVPAPVVKVQREADGVGPRASLCLQASRNASRRGRASVDGQLARRQLQAELQARARKDGKEEGRVSAVQAQAHEHRQVHVCRGWCVFAGRGQEGQDGCCQASP